MRLDASISAQGVPPPAKRRLRDPFVAIIWTVARLDDLIWAFLWGVVALVRRPHRKAPAEVMQVLSGERDGSDAHRLSRDKRYIVLSDHHLLYSGAHHDYFSGFGRLEFHNQRMAFNILQHYADRGYTLVDNGDVEDLVVTEPDIGFALLDALGDGFGGPFSWLLDEEYQTEYRVEQAYRVLWSYEWYFEAVRRLFGEGGRYVKVVGNHDTDLLRPQFADVVAKMYGTKVKPVEWAYLPQENDYPGLVIAHGHQFDPWTCRRTARQVGEAISETFAWAGQGADRIWLEADWRSDIEAMPNKLVRAPSIAPMKRWGVPKFRHMGERWIPGAMRQTFGPPAKVPWLVLGHTHEPRLRQAEHYANTGSAGRYQNLVWGVEVEDGLPRLVAWRLEPTGLTRLEFDDAGDQLAIRSTGDRTSVPSLGQFPATFTRPTPEHVTTNIRGRPGRRRHWRLILVRMVVALLILLPATVGFYMAVRFAWVQLSSDG